jgi:ribonuclease HI
MEHEKKMEERVVEVSYGGVRVNAWLGGFSKYVGMCSAYVAELWGVYEGLRYARRLGFILVELNVDSLVVAKTLMDGLLYFTFLYYHSICL